MTSIGNNNGGSGNFFVGTAGNSTTSGWENTANGVQALLYNTSGFCNTADGYQALFYNNSGYANTADGFGALHQNTTGTINTAIGYMALYSNTNGNFNTAVGSSALSVNTSGSFNIAVGNGAGYNITTGSNNIDIGNQGLSTDTNIIRIGSGQSRTFIAGVINGNGGGLTNLNAAQFASSVLTNGETGLTLGGTFTGNGAGLTSLNASQLTSIGNANGGSGNFFVGPSGNPTTSGSYNTANGVQALLNNTSGYFNTANGFQALVNNKGGWWNTASGDQALCNNTSGNYNTANGHEALCNNTSGSYNTANGVQALFFNTSGATNIALGFAAGQNITGDNNIDIGNSGYSGDSGTIRIGTPGTHTATWIAGIVNNEIFTGGITVLLDPGDFRLGFNPLSSERFKEEIHDMDSASDVLYALRPVTFRYKDDPKGNRQVGLVAEEVEKVDPHLVIHDKQGDPYGVRYDAVNAMLLNEFLKEHKTVESQHTEIQTLKQQNDALAERLNELEATVKRLALQK